MLSHSSQDMLGVILLLLSEVANDIRRRILKVRTLFVELDHYRIEIMADSEIGSLFLSSQLKVHRSNLVEVVCSSPVPLKLPEDLAEGIVSHVGSRVTMHLIVLRDPHRCQDRDM